MSRPSLNDERWSKLKEIILEFAIHDKPTLRMMVEGMLYRMRMGCPWRDLFPEFSLWNTVYQNFNGWSTKEKLLGIFKSLSQSFGLKGLRLQKRG